MSPLVISSYRPISKGLGVLLVIGEPIYDESDEIFFFQPGDEEGER